jgi:hypothetical protein
MANPGVNSNRIYKQIEADADYYEPSIYSALQFYHLFQAQDDPLASDYIPISSSVAYRIGEATNNGKMFVVGLLPPTCNVSGRILDRSASVANIQGGVGEADLGEAESFAASNAPGYWNKGGRIVTAPGYTIPVSGASSNLGLGVPPGVSGCGDKVAVEYLGGGKYKYNCVASVSMPEMYQGLHDAYVRKFGKEPTATEIQFLTAQCWRETGGKMPGNNPGYIGNRPTNPGGWVGFQEPVPGKPGETRTRWFSNFDSVSSGFDAYIRVVGSNPNVLAAARNGDVLGFLTSLAQRGYFGEPIDQYYNNYGKGGGFPAILGGVASAVPQAGLGNGNGLPKNVPQSCAFKETSAQYQKRAKAAGIKSGAAAIARFQGDSPYGPDCPLDTSQGDDANAQTPDWNSTGAANAQQAKKEEEKTGGTDLNTSDLGLKFLNAQQNQIDDTLRQLEVMKNTPPLRMLVNPESFKVSGEKVISDGNWTRRGPIIEHWGDSQDKISGSGKVAGFYAMDYNDGATPGLSRTTRNFSMSYQNFMSLWLLYRSNAGLLLPDYTEGSDNTNFLSVLGSIYIYYDGIIYIGSFDSFNVTQGDTNPFSLEYDFAFTVRAWYELDREDPEQYRYGNASMFTLGSIPVQQDVQKTYEASQAAGDQRRKDEQANWDAAEAERKKADALFRSPDEVMGTETGTGKNKGSPPPAKGNSGNNSGRGKVSAPAKTSQGSGTPPAGGPPSPGPTPPPGAVSSGGPTGWLDVRGNPV